MSLFTDLVHISPATLGVDTANFVLPPVLPPVHTAPAPAGARYPAIYAFGDSLSDVGNAHAVSAGQIPMAPYDNGRFSNGPTWIEDLAARLGDPLPQPSLQGGTDFAYGGAETGATTVHTATPADLPSQLAQFRGQVGTPQPGALYTLWIGGNDLMDATKVAATDPARAQLAVSQAVSNIDGFVNGLADSGARNLLVLNAPDIGQTPAERSGTPPGQAATASALAAQFDQQLATTLHQIAASRGLTLDIMDSYGLLDSAITNPAPYGFADVRDPLWTGDLQGHNGALQATGAAQSQYLFFDRMHPTAQGHAYVADSALHALG